MTETVQGAKIKLAQSPPAYCASCHGQYTDRRHVDFGAAYEGPVLPSGDEVVGVVGVSVDDLIVCEECLTAAAREVGLGDTAAKDGQIEAQAAKLEELTERLAGAMAYADKLEAALQSKPGAKRQTRPARG